MFRFLKKKNYLIFCISIMLKLYYKAFCLVVGTKLCFGTGDCLYLGGAKRGIENFKLKLEKIKNPTFQTES